MNYRTVKGYLAAGAVIFLMAMPVAAVENRITRFANPGTSFHLPALKTQNEARAMLQKRKDDVRVVLETAGWNGKVEDLLRAAEVGTFQETSIGPGSRIPYLAMRKSGRPSVLWNVVWAGRESVPAYYLEFESNGRRHGLTIPKPCSNFWIVDLGLTKVTESAPSSPTIHVPDVQACVTQPVVVTVNVQNANRASLIVSVDGKQVGSGAVTEGIFRTELPAFPDPGSHELTASVGTVQNSGTITVVACPPVCSLTATPAEIRKGQDVVLDASASRVDPQIKVSLKQVSVQVSRDGEQSEVVNLIPPEFSQTIQLKKAGNYTFHATAIDEAGQTSTNTCESSVLVTQPALAFFVDALAGKERMVHEEFPNGRCAAIAGVKFGVLPRLGDHAELEAAVGGKINFRDGDNSAIFADLALNGVFSKGFLGAGVSFWDLNLDDTRAVALLIHGGFHLVESGRAQLIVEGRLPFDQLDDASNNYMFWGGIRIRW